MALPPQIYRRCGGSWNSDMAQPGGLIEATNSQDKPFACAILSVFSSPRIGCEVACDIQE
jgi:hypothetical protein